MQRDEGVGPTGSYGDGVIQAQKEVTESKSSLSGILLAPRFFRVRTRYRQEMRIRRRFREGARTGLPCRDARLTQAFMMRRTCDGVEDRVSGSMHLLIKLPAARGSRQPESMPAVRRIL